MSSFIGDDTIVRTKFKSIEDGLEATRLDGTGLREINWNILECSWFGLLQKRIMLKSLANAGYISASTKRDHISEFYSFNE